MQFDLSNLWDNIAAQFAVTPGEPLMFNSGLFWILAIAFVPTYALLKSRRTAMTVFVIAFGLLCGYKAGGWAVLLMVATAAIDWHLARLIAASDSPQRRRLLLWLSLSCSLGVLVLFKYGNFVLWNFDALLGRNFQPMDLLVPVGVSFYTFRTVSYVVDVYHRKMSPVASYLDYLFYLSFFPCLVAGPIVRAETFMPQLRDNRPATREQVYGGLWLFLIGVVKKAIVADYVAQYVNIVYGNPTGYSGVELLMAILGYTVQIYCDFSGYSDMAIGLGSVMGFDLEVNFDLPYRSLNVTEFWRRWHISLSFWLRDYVYIALGGNRHGKVRQYLNLMVTMLVGGLWHGAAWRFVLWGAGHGAALCVHKLFMRPLRHIPDNALTKFVSWLLTFTLVSLLWVFFRADSVDTACEIIIGTVQRFDWAYLPVFVGVRRTWCIIMAITLALHFVPRRLMDDAREWFIDSFWVVKFVIFVIVVQLVLEYAAADVQPFIYAQF